ncbi:MAG: pyridoxal phosphate-dependent aminotransferase [Betaproteobacteria bacterium]|nr:pyridoxal phosphate-dependent aminotransferase [Betaproteobacteria bacterium]
MKPVEPARSADSLRLAARMAEIEPFHVMEIQRRALELEAAGRRIVHMEIGQPDFSAPQPVIDAAIAALRRDPMGYAASLGLPALRAAIARFYGDRYGVEVDPRRVIVTAGASGAFIITLGALVDPGDEVLMPDPCYPCNRHFVRLFEGKARTVAVDERTHYQLGLAEVQANWGPRTRGVLLASPSNPTGTIVPTAALAAIIDWVHGRGGFVLVDEIYHELVYGEPLPTALALSDEVFLVSSFSKYFCMTGWRLGWIVAPERYVRGLERLAQNAFICAPVPSQHAALAAFEPATIAILEERRLEFQRRRDFLVPALRDLGFRVPITPEGAFYVYAGIERFGLDSHALAHRLIEEAGVAITPGLDFGANQPEQYVRFAYTRAIEELREGVDRLRETLTV